MCSYKLAKWVEGREGGGGMGEEQWLVGGGKSLMNLKRKKKAPRRARITLYKRKTD